MRIPHDSYVLVADGAKMLFFRNEGDAENLDLKVLAAEQQADGADHDIKTDQAGRMPGSLGMGGGSTANESDFHQQAEDRFAVEAANRINRAALANDARRTAQTLSQTGRREDRGGDREGSDGASGRSDRSCASELSGDKRLIPGRPRLIP
jgi:protein required for attachment to host cells